MTVARIRVLMADLNLAAFTGSMVTAKDRLPDILGLPAEKGWHNCPAYDDLTVEGR